MRLYIKLHLEVICLNNVWYYVIYDRLCGLVVRVIGYRSGGPGLIPGNTRKEKLSIASPTNGGRSVGIVRSRVQTMEFIII
jgi:hypothetical protein